MLKVTIPENEFFDEKTSSFIKIPETTLSLEHSLLSISKWEANHAKSFIGSNDKTNEELIDYVRCMTITQNVNPLLYYTIPNSVFKEITDYIGSPMSATKIAKKEGQGSSREVVTSELIYYWMIAYGIPFECEKWHLNRLLNLIKICNIKNNPGKKMSRNEILSRNAALNAARRKSMGSRG